VEALKDKNIIILGDVKLPTSLSAQTISLTDYRTFDPQSSIFNPPSLDVSTTQTQLLVALLCLLAILLL